MAAEDAQEKTAWVNAIADVIVSFRKSPTGATGTPIEDANSFVKLNLASETGAASKEEADLPSGT